LFVLSWHLRVLRPNSHNSNQALPLAFFLWYPLAIPSWSSRDSVVLLPRFSVPIPSAIYVSDALAEHDFVCVVREFFMFAAAAIPISGCMPPAQF